MISSSAAGAIRIMRQLNQAGALPAKAWGADAAHALSCLHYLRDVCGAAAETRAGWRLVYAPQWLSPPPLPLPAAVLEEVDSTQTAARAYPPPQALFAEHQTAGAGQRGRRWLGLPADGIMVSLCLPAPADYTGLPVALGAMLCAALCGSGQLRFKWPNDIVTRQQHKVGGILTELSGGRLIVGVGINWRLTPALRAAVSAMGGAAPAALADLPDAPADRQQCAQRVAQTIIDTAAAYETQTDGFAAFRALAQEMHIAAIGETLQFNGHQTTFSGFDDDGALLTGGARRIRHSREDSGNVVSG